MLKFGFSADPKVVVKVALLFSLVVRAFAAAMVCAVFAPSALAQDEAESKFGKFEAEVGGLIVNLSESVLVANPSFSDRNFLNPVTLEAGTEISPVNQVIATATLSDTFRLPGSFPATAQLNLGALVINNITPITLIHNNMTVEATPIFRQNTVIFSAGGTRIVTVAAGETFQYFTGLTMTTETIDAALTSLPDDVPVTNFGSGARIRNCDADSDAVGGIGASGRFYVVDNFVDVSLEGGFYATVQKGVMRLNCPLTGVDFGRVSFDDGSTVHRNIQSALASKTGEWSANSAYLGLRIEDEFGPLLAFFRVGGHYWTREYDLPQHFNVDGLHYAVDAGGGRNYYVPAPTFQWRGPDAEILSESKQDGFSSHFTFGIRAGRLSASWTRNRQDDFDVDAYQFSYIHEF